MPSLRWSSMEWTILVAIKSFGYIVSTRFTDGIG